jgi:glycosyltransferase involved in cell wall biosynthesis
MVAPYEGKARIVENVPEDPGGELAQRKPEGPVKVWAAGTLDDLHGLRQLLEAVASLDDVLIVSAGWPYDDFAATEFLRSKRVVYHGIVRSDRALELAASCDAVFCYYAPTNENMVNASPNKVYDAMAVGRPILINREVKVASWVVENAVGHAFAYDDVASLRAAISRLAIERSSLPSFAARSRALFGQRSWGHQEPELARIYLDLVPKRS